MKFFAAFIAILLCCIATGFASFQVLRGDNQPSMEDLKMSNTPRLFQYAALTGDKFTVDMYEGNQTVIAQNNVNLVLDCSHMMKPGDQLRGPVKWTRQFYREHSDGIYQPCGPIRTYFRSTYVHKLQGEQQDVLNITSTNIIIGARKNDNGMYTCTVCKQSGCYSANLMLFLIGAGPRMNFVEEGGKLEQNKINNNYSYIILL